MRYEVSVKFHRDFVEVDRNKITAGLATRPVKGEANRELIRRLARHFGVPSSNVKIAAGFRSKQKIVEIT